MKTYLINFFRWKNLSMLWSQWWFWAAIAATCFGLEAAALFYQHVLDIRPCELCIYVRVWLTGIFILSLLAMILCRFTLGGLLASLTGIALSIGLGKETYNLLVVENNWGHGGACSFFPNFPTWAPLDKWIPFLFEVQEVCQATPEVLLGISMAESLALVSLGFCSVFLLGIIGSIKKLFT